MHVLILALRTQIIKTKFPYEFFLTKWLSHNFNRKILRKKRSGVGGLVALQFVDYLKRQLELLIFYERL